MARIKTYRGKPVFCSTGNFLFDQSWSEGTSPGIFAELTLHEGRVAQARPVPFVLLDYAQPNFLCPRQAATGACKRSTKPRSVPSSRLAGEVRPRKSRATRDRHRSAGAVL